MGNINKDGIWTPDENDTVEPDVWSATMADSISSGLGDRVRYLEGEDTGWVLGAPAAGWTKEPTSQSILTPGYVRGRRRGYMVELMLRMTRNGPDIHPGNYGNIENEVVATVPKELMPTSWWHPLKSGPVGVMASGTIDDSGKIRITAIPPGFVLKAGYEISLGGSYFIDLGKPIL